MKEAGANTVRIYDTLDLMPILDKAHELGLAVVVDIPLEQYRPEFDYTTEYTEEKKEKLIPSIQKYKDHPALLYWNLGNEIKYPVYYERTNFVEHFNTLLKTIKKIDPEHPVSTTFAGTNRGRLNNLVLRSPELDFFSFQTFGGLKQLQDRLDDFLLAWDGPYVVSEWGINGPWEEQVTSWGAPIEPTSTKKAEQLLERYSFPVLHDENSLGNFYFYWGNKHERTNSWFSTFSETGEKYEVYDALQKSWSKNSPSYEGPQINYALLNKKGSPGSIILSPAQKATAKVYLAQVPSGKIDFRWIIKKEAWADEMKEPEPIDQNFLRRGISTSSFRAPKEEGPYRLFYFISDDKGNIATTNIPFYVLNPQNEE